MIRAEQITKTYRTKRGDIQALSQVDFQVSPGEFVIVKGPSGSGKTTLLFALGGMLRPSNGAVKLDEHDLYSLTRAQRARVRADRIGFVFQMFHLTPYLTVLENVMLPLGASKCGATREDAIDLLNRVGLDHRLDHRPAELSAGECQRAAIARAFLRKPSVILADEPTGNLDPDNAKLIMSHLNEYAQQGGAVVLVTHGETGEEYAHRIAIIRDGRLEIARS
ncbi:MAG: ATP-binding cassette domain-containing protein [bacterium]|nr:ATP-binding cassette domain-containing protein [bacterium]